MRPRRCFGDAGPWFLSLVAYLRAILAVRRGNADEAIALVRESLTRIRELHDKFAFVYALVPLAAAAALKGDDAWAARILGARDAVTERHRRHCRRQIRARPPRAGGAGWPGPARPRIDGPARMRPAAEPLSIR